MRGRYEQDEIALVRTLLKPGDTAIDAGSHIGFFTMVMASLVGPGGHVYAFEPLDSNAELLERSVAENRFADRIAFRRAAVGAASGSATLTFPAETLNSGGAYLLRSGTAPLTGNQTRQVPMIALDDMPLERPVRLIKMDVEGAEPQVLKGAERLLQEDRPAVLSEVHPTQLDRASGMGADAFFGQVRALGYRVHAIEDGGVGAPLDQVPQGAIVSVVLLPR